MTDFSVERPLVAFYGDDFTGSTDAMEVLAFAGVPTILLLRDPTKDILARFCNYRAIGVAGIARSMSPAWMRQNLPPIFKGLAELRPHILHYKVCSTFDSGPTVGSIGQAIELGMTAMDVSWSPVVVGAPQLQRWQAFGNLFAGTTEQVYRLDRHPTMSRHPVTPMDESDLRVHLGRQTGKRIGLVDIVDLQREDVALEKVREQSEIVLFDVLDEISQRRVGRAIWENRGPGLFSASSSGLDYALVAHWRETGVIPQEPPEFPALPAAGKILVVSGSCSPRTAEQITAAEEAGFATCRLDVIAVADPARQAAAISDTVERAGQALHRGQSVVIFAARTVDDPAFGKLAAYCADKGLSFDEAQSAIGDSLGSISHRLLCEHRLTRLVVAGGDTSGRVVSKLPLIALETLYPLVRGAPVCRAYSDEPAFHGLEVVLKGGQIGEADLFVVCRGAQG